MLKIEIKEGEKIDRAIKRYRRKVRNTKLIQEIRERKHYEKPSKKRRVQFQKARYKDLYLLANES